MTRCRQISQYSLCLPSRCLPGTNKGRRRMRWRRLQAEETKRGMNKALIEVIPSSHLKIGNHQAISYFHYVYRTKKKRCVSLCVRLCVPVFASQLILSALTTSQTNKELTDKLSHFLQSELLHARTHKHNT